jgi:DNA-binding protein H-NS
MAGKDLEKMSYKDLQQHLVRVQRAIAMAHERDKEAVRKKIDAIAREAGFKISDLYGGRGGKGRKVPAKYANPDNPSETWTGRGRKPRWLAEKLKNGERIEKFLIK